MQNGKINNFCVVHGDFPKRNDAGNVHYLEDSANPTRILFSGLITNFHTLREKYGVESSDVEDLVRAGVNTNVEEFAEQLEGCFSLVHIAEGRVLFFSDNLRTNYFFYYHRPDKGIIISNNLLTFRKFITLEPRQEMITRYFLSISTPAPITFFKGIQLALPFEVMQYDTQNKALTKRPVKAYAYEHVDYKEIDDETIVNTADEIFTHSVENILKSVDNPFPFIAFSGGKDSSYLDCVLQKRGIDHEGVNYSFMHGGQDAKYTQDIAEYNHSKVRYFEYDPKDFLSLTKSTIKNTGFPWIYDSEGIAFETLRQMHESTMGMEQFPIFINGTGTGIFGQFHASFEMLFTHQYPYISKLLSMMNIKKMGISRNLKLSSQALKGNFDEKIMLGMFELTGMHNAVRNSFKESDIYDSFSYDVQEMNRFDTDAIGKIHRYTIFSADTERVVGFFNYMYNLNSFACGFPFRSKALYKYLIQIHPFRKLHLKLTLKQTKGKYPFLDYQDRVHEKRAIEKYLPHHLVYRQKIAKNVPYWKLFQTDPGYQKVFQSIAKKKYEYFNFDVNELLRQESKSNISLLKLLYTFHLWHEYFIENK